MHAGCNVQDTSIFSFSKNVFFKRLLTYDCLQTRLCNTGFNSLPNEKILDWSKLKAFADDKINMSEKLNFLEGKVENIAGKRRKCIFSFSPQCFQKPFFFQGCSQSRLCGKQLTLLQHNPDF